MSSYFFANGTLWITKTGTIEDISKDINSGKIKVGLGQIVIDVKGPCYIFDGKEFFEIGVEA